jgi:hypothetical protein
MLEKILAPLMGGLMAGVAVSSFRHYYHRYADEEDLRMNEYRKVIIIDDLSKKDRRKK